MTAPFSSVPPGIVWFVCLGSIAVAIAMPFARRDDLLGWLSLLVIATFAAILWAVMIVNAISRFVAWRRDKPIEPDDPRVGECYTEYVYTISWDHDSLSVRTHSGEFVFQVPLANVLDVVHLDKLLIDGDIVLGASNEQTTFPESRSARFKILRLIADLAGCRVEVRRGLERTRAKFMRQFAVWFPVSLLTAGFLLIPIVADIDPPRGFFLGAFVCVPYGLAWWWLLWKFAFSLACFFSALELRSMLRHGPKRGRTLQ